MGEVRTFTQREWDEREERFLACKQELTEDCVNLQAALRRAQELHRSAEMDLRDARCQASDLGEKWKQADRYAGKLERDLEVVRERLTEALCAGESMSKRIDEAVYDERRDAVTIDLLRSDKAMLEDKLRAADEILKKHVATIDSQRREVARCDERIQHDAAVMKTLRDGRDLARKAAKQNQAAITDLSTKLAQEERLRCNALAALNVNDGVMMELRNQVADRDQIIAHLKKQIADEKRIQQGPLWDRFAKRNAPDDIVGTENGKMARNIGDKIAALVGRHGFQISWSGGVDGPCGLCRKVLTDPIHFTDGEMRAATESGP